MQTRRHTAIGKLVVFMGKRVAKRKAQANKAKLAAAGVVAAVVAGGIAASRSGSEA